MKNPFTTPEMALGYANARPPVHPRVIELLQPLIAGRGPVRRALDVGCGAGLSTRALAPVADRIFGIEPAERMLQCRASIAPGAHFVVGVAEKLPFRCGSIDLIAAAGSLNYVRLELFFPEARRVLAPGGILVVYDFSHGRSFQDCGTLDVWYDEFLRRYPPLEEEGRPLSPEILKGLDSGFELRHERRFDIAIALAPKSYIEYVLTNTNVAAAVRRGISMAKVRKWCEETLAPIWGDRSREVLFRGYFACLAGHHRVHHSVR